jgi:hypothetical protein
LFQSTFLSAKSPDFQLKSGAMNISRENGTRVVAIGVFIKGRDMGSVVNDIKQRVSKIQMPPGYNRNVERRIRKPGTRNEAAFIGGTDQCSVDLRSFV